MAIKCPTNTIVSNQSKPYPTTAIIVTLVKYENYGENKQAVTHTYQANFSEEKCPNVVDGEPMCIYIDGKNRKQ